MNIPHADIKAHKANGLSFAAIGRHYNLGTNESDNLGRAYKAGRDYKPRGGQRKPMTAAILSTQEGIDLYTHLDRKLSGLCGAYGLSYNDAKFLNAIDRARDAILAIDAEKLEGHENPMAYAFMRAKGAATDSLSGYESKNGGGMDTLPAWLQE